MNQHTRTLTDRIVACLVGATLLVLNLASSPPSPTPVGHATVVKRTIEYVLQPHEDDEWEVWSQVENRTDTFKVFIVMTRGEQTSFCARGALASGLQPTEVAPTPAPSGQWTASCGAARLSSWAGFFTQMSATDPTIPGDFGTATATRQFPANGTSVCHYDGNNVCVADRSALVFKDRQQRGVLISWDLGDGDLTSSEVTWATQNVLANPAEFGIPTGLRASEMWGAYANSDPACFVYTHPDHLAVQQALHDTAFQVGTQGAATCGASPGTVTRQVSAVTMKAAFEVGSGGQRIGAHPRWYGWLDNDYYHLSQTDQSDLFMGKQSFWVVTSDQRT